MVKFGLTVLLRFGLMVKYSAFRFYYDSAFRIRPNGPVRLSFNNYCQNVYFNILSTYPIKLKGICEDFEVGPLGRIRKAES